MTVPEEAGATPDFDRVPPHGSLPMGRDPHLLLALNTIVRQPRHTHTIAFRGYVQTRPISP